MAKRIKVPRRIGGVKIPKPARKAAKRILGRVQGEQLEALAGVIVAAMLAHVVERDGKTRLSQRVGRAVGRHLAG